MPTVIPFHRAVVRDEAFTTEPFTVHTRWIETEWDNQVQPYDAAPAERGGRGAAPDRRRRGRRTAARGVPARRSRRRWRGARRGRQAPQAGGGGSGAGASGDSLTSPMQGTIVKVAVEDGATVEAGDLIVVLEAMKMEQPITAHKAGTVTGLSAEG